MILYKPLELQREGKGTGLWHYTCSEGEEGRTRTYAVGYCAVDCLGHKTPGEAVDHFEQYLLDTSSAWENQDQMLKCVVDGCGKFTMGRIRHGIAGPFAKDYALCDEHKNKEELKKFLEAERAQRRAEQNARASKYRTHDDWIRAVPERERRR